ncbi:MAG: Na+/H+ antiporter subunit E [Chloroflexota bacterium]|nr:Na+/H+ antiporter subunit E [Chloroflexota bacterium]
MSSLLANLLLALVWVAMTGDLSPANLLVGLVLGFVALFAAQTVLGSTPYARRMWRVVAFLGFYIGELIMSNVRVAADVVTPRHRAQPGVVAVPLDAQTDAEITLLANLITMTPGSLTLDVSDDRRVLYVHAMFVRDPDAYRQRLKNTLERRVLEMTR